MIELDRRRGRTAAPLGPQLARPATRESRRASARVSDEALLRRAALLPAVDRLLLDAALRDGRSARQLAALHRTSVRRMTARLARLRRVLADPLFVFLADSGEGLPRIVRRIIRSHFGHGLTLRQCAKRYGLSLYEVRQRLAVAQSLRLLAAHQHAAADGTAHTHEWEERHELDGE